MYVLISQDEVECFIFFTAEERLLALRPTSNNCEAPFAAKALAIANPIPRDAPVMIAFLPVSFDIFDGS